MFTFIVIKRQMITMRNYLSYPVSYVSELNAKISNGCFRRKKIVYTPENFNPCTMTD